MKKSVEDDLVEVSITMEGTGFSISMRRWCRIENELRMVHGGFSVEVGREFKMMLS